MSTRILTIRSKAEQGKVRFGDLPWVLSLWNILMNLFDGNDYAQLLAALQEIETKAGTLSLTNSDHIDKKMAWLGRQLVKWAQSFSEEHRLLDCFRVAEDVHSHLREKGELLNVSTLESEVKHVKDALIREAQGRSFLVVATDRHEFLNAETIFGPEVCKAFPSVSADIKEACNCLAAECNTASVFHLMRAVEFSLRAIARDRDISFADKPLEEKQWGEILPKLETVVGDLRKENRNSWSIPEAREPQIRFYAEIAQELRAFNDVWRRHVSHADTGAFYDRDQAMSVFNHVRAFMRKAASKISETSVTNKYWDRVTID